METLTYFFDFTLYIDVYLKDVMMAYGPLVYGILFLIVFCETGLVVTAFLPGDSILFVAGTLVGTGMLSGSMLIPWLVIAATGQSSNLPISAGLTKMTI